MTSFATLNSSKSLSPRLLRSIFPVVFAGLLLATPAQMLSQETVTVSKAPSRLVDPIDEHARVTLKGNVRQDLASAPDLGLVEDGKELHLFLLLQRTTAQQADLDNLIQRQQQPTAAEYHKWLTPKEFGARFGASPEDIAKISAWLESHGFKIRSVLNNASMIDFAATAGQVREAFHTDLRYFNMNGKKYLANVSDPQVPAALAPVVAGIKGLTKIPRHMNHTQAHQGAYDKGTHRWNVVNPSAADKVSPAWTDGAGDYDVTPQDLYTIYNVNPVFTGGNLAASATVAVIEQSDIEFGTVNGSGLVTSGGDVNTFRGLFGVPGTLTMHVMHGAGLDTCTAPGIDPDGIGEDLEASLDAEWINATAPSANLIFMSCDQDPDQGVDTSMAALIDNNISDVMSLSYGESELYFVTSDYTFQDTLYSLAATQGQSFLVSSGDSGSDVADQNTSGTAESGINVSALGSPLVTVAGGTDFQDLYDALDGGPAQSTYWAAANTADYGDALSYVPETSWNESCASSLFAVYAGFTGAGLCADFDFLNDGTVVGGSGGISAHYAVPAWQTGISGYSNANHSQPDISGFASSGFWGHALIFCDSNPADGGAYTCTSDSTFGLAGGTSFVAPYMAGAIGLLRTATGSRQGVLNPALYALGKAQFTGAGTATACYSNGQTSNSGVTTGLPAASCIFNDVTTSNNDVPCQAGSASCYVDASANYGMLSLNGSNSLSVAFPSTIGFDQVTGIGTVNIANLIGKWNTAFTSSTGLTASLTSITSGQSTKLTATVTGGTPTGYVDTPPTLTGQATFKAGTTSLGNCTLSGGTCQLSVAGSALQAGANSVTATFTGSGTYPSSVSSIVTVTVTGGSTQTTTTLTSSANPINYGQSVTFTAHVAPSNSGTPTGSVSFYAGSTLLGTGTLNGSDVATFSISSFAPGTYSITAVYSGDSNYLTSTSTALSEVVNKASQTITFAALPSLTYGTAPFTVSASASSGLAVSFASTTPSICTVSGTNVTLVGAQNNCTIQATQAGNNNYAAAPAVSQSSYVKRGTQVITFATIPPQPYGKVLALSATASSGLPVSFASTTSSVCTVSTSTATMIATGTCTIQATQAGNSNYLAAGTVSRSFKVTQATQTITFPALPALTHGETGVTVSATASSGLPVTFTSTTPSICTVSGTNVNVIGGASNCTIEATQAGNSNYAAAPVVTQSSYVKRATQSITFSAISVQADGASLPLSATASSGLAVSFASTTTSVCTVSGTTATMIAVGTCTIQASQAGNSNYLAAGTVSRSFKVELAQTITFPALPSLTYGEPGVALSATASSGLPVTFASTTPSVCTVSGTAVTLVGAQSNCTIQATQAGNSNYAAAPAVTQSTYVKRATQAITFPTIPTTALSAGSVSMSATASSSLVVSFASTTPSVCTVSNTTATLVSAGTCTIQATQAGNSDYLAAATVTRSFTVTAN